MELQNLTVHSAGLTHGLHGYLKSDPYKNNNSSEPSFRKNLQGKWMILAEETTITFQTS